MSRECSKLWSIWCDWAQNGLRYRPKLTSGMSHWTGESLSNDRPSQMMPWKMTVVITTSAYAARLQHMQMWWSRLSLLVFKISSDIGTKHCYQVCVLSMIFCHSDCRLCAPFHETRCCRDSEIGKLLGVPHGLTSPRRANVAYEKYTLHLIFTFYLNRDTPVLELFPVVVFHLQ